MKFLLEWRPPSQARRVLEAALMVTGAAASFSFLIGITTDGVNLYVTDASNYAIRKIVIATGAVTTLAGTPGTSGNIDGTGAAASFMKFKMN